MCVFVCCHVGQLLHYAMSFIYAGMQQSLPVQELSQRLTKYVQSAEGSDTPAEEAFAISFKVSCALPRKGDSLLLCAV